MILYGLKTCDTCRKALAELAAASREARFVDLRSDGLPEALLRRLVAEQGEAALNRRSTTWRGLPEDERARPLEDLLRRHPTLIKRPVIEEGSALHVGWSPQVRAALGLQ